MSYVVVFGKNGIPEVLRDVNRISLKLKPSSSYFFDLECCFSFSTLFFSFKFV